AKGRPICPTEVHFETWTLRYNRMFWLTIDGLEKHWERARVDGEIRKDGWIVIKTQNITDFRIDIPANATRFAPSAPVKVLINFQKQEMSSEADGSFHAHFRGSASNWMDADDVGVALGPLRFEGVESISKRHGLQGPIDDAFLDSFIIVRPT